MCLLVCFLRLWDVCDTATISSSLILFLIEGWFFFCFFLSGVFSFSMLNFLLIGGIFLPIVTDCWRGSQGQSPYYTEEGLLR